MSYLDLLAEESVRNRVMPLSVAQYHQLDAAGLISEKTELLDGIIFKKMTKSPLHEFIAHKLYRFFLACVGDAYLVRKEAPLTLSTSEPEPDISIVEGRLDEFIDAHPNSAELVIEIAVSSSKLDRGKAAIYAAAGVPEYWIVLADSRQIERYTDPSLEGYKTKAMFTATQSLDTRWGTLNLQAVFGTGQSASLTPQKP